MDCSIDQDLMEHGEEVAAALRAGKDGGIPWFVFLNPSKPILAPDSKTGVHRRREAAILATADGPEGNVGCPVALEERTHFLACLSSARISLSDEELLRIAEQQRAFAEARDSKYGQAVEGIPASPTSFSKLDSDHKEAMAAYRKELKERRSKGEKTALPLQSGIQETYFPKFRALAKNYLASPDDRGQALFWCFSNFRKSGIDWKNPGAIQTGLAYTLIHEWSESEWASGLASAIARNQGTTGFNAEAALVELEGRATSPVLQANAAFSRASLFRRSDEDKFEKELTHFLQKFPDDKRTARAEGYLRNLRTLRIGKKAPDFTGADVDGNPIALSDYKGKVTYIVFWGFW